MRICQLSRGRSTAARLLSLIAVASVSACMVGPNYRRPSLPADAGYAPDPLPSRTASAPTPVGASQAFVSGRDIPGDWWTLFGSPALAKLVALALANNPSVAAAQASLAQAEQSADATAGGLFPTVSGKLSTMRLGFSGASIGQTYAEDFTLSIKQISVSYTLDLFGATRRQIEAAEAQADYQRYQLEAADLTLTSNLVAAAIQEASLQEQVAVTQDIIQIETGVLRTMQLQLTAGAASDADVLTQQTSLAQTAATLPGLEQSLKQQRILLDMLIGQFPSQPLPATVAFDTLHLPETLPVSLPSSLVAQRPDVASAAAQLHSATAQVGVATANLLPQISLSAGDGVIALGQLLGPGTPIWNLGVNLTQPLFQGGQLVHQRRAAVAGMQAAAAQYRSTVLGAFQNVADALAALETDADTLSIQAAADQASKQSLAISLAQYHAGAISFLTLLNAENARAQVRVALIRVETNRYLDTVALYQALGGGWWNRNDTAMPGKS
jgi:NodT family efflux transporter outer membrane factor (OMF) lipoprotein